MSVSSQEIALSRSIWTSKHLVVVLGMNFYLLSIPLTFMEGAGVSQAAGIQTFQGTGGLFSPRLNKGSVLELFQKDTFEVRWPLPLSLVC